ncbi:DUF3418 domain-containing protein [Klebsiella pneumoniae]|nr:DUF3418 domain-containing protein [Klebsiella pneumoniae]
MKAGRRWWTSATAYCRLFDNQEQQQAMWRGLRRLLLLNIPSPIKYLHEKLPNKAKLGLCTPTVRQSAGSG